jgi:hypothetical protein
MYYMASGLILFARQNAKHIMGVHELLHTEDLSVRIKSKCEHVFVVVRLSAPRLAISDHLFHSMY